MTANHAQPTLDVVGGDRLLRQSLRLDAAASGAMGVLLAAGGTLLDDLFGIPSAVLVSVGGFLVVYAAALWLLGAVPG
jgi:hypothetical protein